jgi:hypothetical protein
MSDVDIFFNRNIRTEKTYKKSDEDEELTAGRCI